MSHEPNFDELVGTEPEGAERERLRRAHELLLLAGPPPELPPRLEQPPDLGRGVQLVGGRGAGKRVVLLLAATLAIAVIFGIGYTVGRGKHANALATIQLRGSSLAPRATASLDVLPAQGANWPMTLRVRGLPVLQTPDYYIVYLVRGGKRIAPCGTFVVSRPSQPLTLTLNAPYKLRAGDTWVVAKWTKYGAPSPTVLKPVTT